MFENYDIDYVEIFAPMIKPLVYWHCQALGFKVSATIDDPADKPGICSYWLTSGDIKLVLTSVYPMLQHASDPSISSFIGKNYCGIKRLALRVDSVKDVFDHSIAHGAFPVRFPSKVEDEFGYVEEAAIRLYDDREIVFINRDHYKGSFKPGYKATSTGPIGPSGTSGSITSNGRVGEEALLQSIDHIAAELRINECSFWSEYVSKAIGVPPVQHFGSSPENKTGMVLTVNQSPDKKLTLVMAEPESYQAISKVQKNIDNFGPGIHHLAFETRDLARAITQFRESGVEFVNFPSSYYQLIRANPAFQNIPGIDIDALEANGILIDKEEDTFLLQKFIKPVSDRPFFFYEIVQRVNGYTGFALGNINVLKKAEEMQIIRN